MCNNIYTFINKDIIRNSLKNNSEEEIEMETRVSLVFLRVYNIDSYKEARKLMSSFYKNNISEPGFAANLRYRTVKYIHNVKDFKKF